MTDAGLDGLAGLEPLKALDLAETNVTNAGLKKLAALKQLQSLNLAVTQVTDAGLKELAALKQLQFLDLRGTKVTDGGRIRCEPGPLVIGVGRTGSDKAEPGRTHLSTQGIDVARVGARQHGRSGPIGVLYLIPKPTA